MAEYDPYAGGWTVPSWYQWGGYGGPMEDVSYQDVNLASFLNYILPFMRTEEDMLTVAYEIAGLAPQNWYGGYASATGTGGTPPRAWSSLSELPPGYIEAAIEQIYRVPLGIPTDRPYYVQENEALRDWLSGIFSLAETYNMGVTSPLLGIESATRAQQSEFETALGETLSTGPVGSEAYAPWIEKLFLPTIGRQIPGMYEYNPQTGLGTVIKNPRFR